MGREKREKSGRGEERPRGMFSSTKKGLENHWGRPKLRRERTREGAGRTEVKEFDRGRR